MKTIRCLLSAMLLLGCITGTIMAENEEYTYFAALRFNPPGYYHDTIGISFNTATASADLYCSTIPVVVLLPEGTEPGEGDFVIGARLTFTKPFDVFLGEEDFEFLSVANDVVLEPTRIEVVGKVLYGFIVEIGDDYVIHEAFESYGGQTARYTIMPDTYQMWANSTYQPGSGTGCQMIVDDKEVVLAMRVMHG